LSPLLEQSDRIRMGQLIPRTRNSAKRSGLAIRRFC
jgi:hypothetical protein